MEKERTTVQKEIILNYLKGNKNHPSAQEVYSAIKKRWPSISLGTVYRNLKNFQQRKKIQAIQGQKFHYDFDNCSHGHFICQKCNAIFDIFENCRECEILQSKKTKVGKINHYQIYFYGTCKKCVAKN